MNYFIIIYYFYKKFTQILMTNKILNKINDKLYDIILLSNPSNPF